MKKNDGWKFFFGLAVVVVAVIAVMIVMLMSAGVSFGQKIAVISLKGTVTYSPQFFMESTIPEDVFAMLEKAEEDNSIKGVLIEINSPGGSVVASREIAYAVKNMEKPTLCWMGDVAASGAYWIASSCDYIMADPLSITGSIGVTASYLEFSKLFEKYGITYEQLTSGENKDAGSPFRNMTIEEREKMEYLVEEIFQYFLDDVVKNRGLSETQVENIISGDIFLGKDAVDLGLIDSVGTIQEAKEKSKELAGLEDADFVELRKSGISLFDLLGML